MLVEVDGTDVEDMGLDKEDVWLDEEDIWLDEEDVGLDDEDAGLNEDETRGTVCQRLPRSIALNQAILKAFNGVSHCSKTNPVTTGVILLI